MKILLLASGGDAPGMNKIIFNLFKKYKSNIWACEGGFKGLIEGKISSLSRFEPEKFKNQAGCCIKSARCLEFKTEKGFKKGLKNAKKFDAVVILGGNGSFEGAKRLASKGVKVVFVPVTIDNDVEISEYSLGFHTAVKACCDAIYNIMPSMNAFNRCCVFEVMGRKYDKIAFAVAQVTNPDALISNEEDLNFSKISKIVRKNFKNNNSSFIVIRENILNLNKFVSTLKTMVKDIDIKTFVVGHLQRGTKPTRVDLKKANEFSKCIFKSIKTKNMLDAVTVKGGKTFLKEY